MSAGMVCSARTGLREVATTTMRYKELEKNTEAREQAGKHLGQHGWRLRLPRRSRWPSSARWRFAFRRIVCAADEVLPQRHRGPDPEKKLRGRFRESVRGSFFRSKLGAVRGPRGCAIVTRSPAYIARLTADILLGCLVFSSFRLVRNAYFLYQHPIQAGSASSFSQAIRQVHRSYVPFFNKRLIYI